MTEAFIRLETPSDFRDAIFLLMSGVNVGFEPVTGALTGFLRPVDPIIVRRVSDRRVAQIRPMRKTWHVKLKDDPASIADAVLELLTNKEANYVLTVDLGDLASGDRSELFGNAFLGFVTALNYRASRLLSRTDIVDLMDWLARLAEARADAQVPYGDAEWGAFVRRERLDAAVLGWNAPADSVLARTLVCHVRPARDDMERLFAHLTRTGETVGLVNAKTMTKTVPYFRGVGPTQTLPLANYVVAPIHDDAYEAYMLALEPLDPSLQPAWHHQRAALRSCGAFPGEASLKAAWQTADDLRAFRTLTVATDPRHVQAISAVAVPDFIDGLLGGWDDVSVASVRVGS